MFICCWETQELNIAFVIIYTVYAIGLLTKSRKEIANWVHLCVYDTVLTLKEPLLYHGSCNFLVQNCLDLLWLCRWFTRELTLSFHQRSIYSEVVHIFSILNQELHHNMKPMIKCAHLYLNFQKADLFAYFTIQDTQNDSLYPYKHQHTTLELKANT